MSCRLKRFHIDIQVKNSVSAFTNWHSHAFIFSPRPIDKKLDNSRNEELIGNWEMFNIIEAYLGL